jgi:hypothetical protein
MAAGTRVELRPLAMRKEGSSWVVGRMETGDFILVPPAAHRVITLLADGCSVAEATRALQEETGKAFEVDGFVASLDDLGFIAAIDGQAREGPAPLRPSLPWLRPQAVRWLLHPATALVILTVLAAALVAVVSHPALLPSYHSLVWNRHSGIVLMVNAAIAWTLAGLHELGHLATARAAGVPARISLGTRLQFLVAQTDVSGVRAAPRRTRLTVYSAGIVVNLLVAACCALICWLADPGGLTRQLLLAGELESLLVLPLQLLIFMRTDVYFIAQDLSGCASLYADGAARIRYVARRAIRRPGTALPEDPARHLTPSERRAVRAYGWLLLYGTTVTVAAAVFITAPATVALLAHAFGELTSPGLTDRADGVAALAVTGSFQLLWLLTWWRRHGGQVSGFLSAFKLRTAEWKGGDT